MGTSTLSDIPSIVRLAKTGNKESLSLLIELTQSRFYKFMYGVTGDKYLADDMCQEAYIKALENIGGLKDDNKFVAWLYRTGKNLFFDHVKQKINKSEPLDDSMINDSATVKVSSTDDVIHINQVLQTLDVEDRVVLLLIDMDGHSYSEAAGLLDLSEDAVRMRLFRARQKFVSSFETSDQVKSSIKWENENEFKKGI